MLGVDTSPRALTQAQRHAELNGVGERCSFEQADVAEVLARGETFDLIVLDPPALAKSRKHVRKALGLYQNLNAAAMQALNPEGILVSCSCSHFVAAADFQEMLKRASAAARRSVCVLSQHGAAPDHPVLLSMPETSYLKAAILRVT